MNCFECRRRVVAAPRQIGDATRSHLRDCSACGAFASRLAAQDEDFEAALRVTVPDGLADRVLFRIGQDHGARGLARWLQGGSAAVWSRPPLASVARRRMAIATLVLAPVAVASWHFLRRGDDALARDVLDHVMHDEPAELASHPQGDPAALPGVLVACGLRLPPEFRSVRYLGRCGPPEHSGEHLVIVTPLGKASIVAMPRHSVSRRVVAVREGAVAVLTPARLGSLAVVAADEQTALRVVERLV